MGEASGTDYPARALAFERRLVWQSFHERFVPPWGVKGDIAGWAAQQRSPVPLDLDHTGLLIPAGEGWTQNLFTCFATTAAPSKWHRKKPPIAASVDARWPTCTTTAERRSFKF